jgi:signal transduction histidine kinase/nitrogen-specific signal transduction histidine kinase/ActR/RegA family two-component response regulator
MPFFNSLQKTLTWSMILLAVLAIGLVGSLWITQELIRFDTEADAIREEFIESQKALIKLEVDRVIDYIEYQRASTEAVLKKDIQGRVEEAIAIADNLHRQYQGVRNQGEIKEMIREALRTVRFNSGRGYFFIYDMEGTNVLLPFSPQLEGRNLWDLQDAKGLYTIRRMTELMRAHGEGFLRWHWYKPGETGRMSEKIGYAKVFQPYGWWIGTGEYIEDVNTEIQQETLARINTIRFGADGYIFVYDFDATTLAHYKAENIGLNQWEFRDANGVAVLQELIRLCQGQGGGYLQYVGTIRPTTGEPAEKIGYARAIKDWRWVVGTGIYVDVVNEILAAKRAALDTKIQRGVAFIGLILLGSLILIALLSRLITSRLAANMRLFDDFFEDAASTATPIDAGSVHFTEFRRLAAAANRMVEERNRTAASLEEAQLQLVRSRKMEALGVLAGSVAHDLNNVLAAIVGYPDLLLISLPPGDPQRRYIEAIRDSGLKASEIVQDLLALARRGVMQPMVIRLNDLVRTYLASPEHVKVVTGNPGVRVETDLAADLLRMRGSRVHLQKTLMNLVANAAEAQPHGGTIRITTENRYLDRPLSGYDQIGEGEYVVLAVGDEGTGISPADLDHIFEPFFSRKALGRSGTGLGMAVVWGTVQDHGGHINVSTAEGKGTLFELYFPATREDSEETAPEPDLAEYRGTGQSLLLVDDIAEQRELARTILEGLGYAVRTAASGEEAVAELRRRPADLLILDMLMAPGMDGLDTYRQVLTINPRQRALIVSGYAETHRVAAAMELGVSRYVKKPYTLRTLAVAVREALAAPPPTAG